jgi:BirA family biotin operon repressor/biotin-[acetyl-CoA-carboxylase] ligase
VNCRDAMSVSYDTICRLFNVADLNFDVVKFQSLLKTQLLGRFFIYRRETESTMKIATSEMSDGCVHGTLVMAESQTKGVGRGGRSWISCPAGNLYISLVVRPKAVGDLYKLNFAAALAVVFACKVEGVDANIKWPNDVWLNGKKLSGMLVDTSIMGSNIAAVIGIGVNLNEDMSQCADVEVRKTATSVYNVLGRPVVREVFLANLCNFLEELICKNMSDLIENYRKYDILVGHEIIVMPKGRNDPERRVATAVGFTNEGALQVRFKDDGSIRTLVSEEVTIRPFDGSL